MRREPLLAVVDPANSQCQYHEQLCPGSISRVMIITPEEFNLCFDSLAAQCGY
jgi:hypothetical protein